MTAPQTDATTDPQSTITKLRRQLEGLQAERDAGLAREASLVQELAAREAALAQRTSEFGERIDQQAATLDVLKAMSASPGDAQPVFDVIVRRAQELCNGAVTALLEYDGQLVHFRSEFGSLRHIAPDAMAAYKNQYPMAPTPTLNSHRAMLERRIIYVRDMEAEPEANEVSRALGLGSEVQVPLLRRGESVGVMALASMQKSGFSDSQIELLKTFAEQAVIAIISAETYRALHTRTADLQESLEYQTATSEVLKVISRSTFDVKPVFETVAATAVRLCHADQAGIYLHHDGEYTWASGHSQLPEYERIEREVRIRPGMGTLVGRTALQGRPIQIRDAWTDELYEVKEDARVGDVHTLLGVPLLRDGFPIGVIGLGRQKIEPFTARQVELVSTFASQAVIAMENARLLAGQREALEQQTATAEVLQVINEFPGNLAPVFDAILEKAHSLCGANKGAFVIFNGELFQLAATRNLSDAYTKILQSAYPEAKAGYGNDALSPREQLLNGADLVHLSGTAVTSGPIGRAVVELENIHTLLFVPLRRDDTLLGYITAYREEAFPFSDKQIALLQNFAAQAVIAMENARLLDEIRQRQEELRITFENMGDGVAMFDANQCLVSWNGKFQEIYDLPDALLEQHRTYEEHLRFLAERGDFGTGVENAEQIEALVSSTGQPYGYERTLPDGRVVEIRRNPVPDGGFVLIFSDITERKRSEAEVRAARDAAEAALRDLQSAQANLVQAEKMASLGQLTAGIAHEIKNPLNFVNNFAALSVDLLDELKEAAEPGFAALSAQQRAEVEDVSAMLTSNLEKITEHGKRADGIVKAMLEHSRGSPGERRMVDLNALIDDALNLAYHGARAQDQSFNVLLERDFEAGIAPIALTPQDMTRVLLNLFSNGFYAINRRVRAGADAQRTPELKVTTHSATDAVEIRVRDNGTGIPADVMDKLFQPFFTTKPTGEGTGLGLSISYDIVTQQHGGSITVDSKNGEYTEFTIRLPRNS
jgi:signal transduction histidine kinase/GAF domain-containing protein